MTFPETFEPSERRRRSDAERVMLMALFARLDTIAMTLAMGVVVSLGLFLATAILLIQGAPAGVPVGPNLNALSTFLPGYQVTWPGALTGAFYGFLIGAGVGFVLSVLWNFTHLVFIGFAAIRGNWLD